MKLPKRKRKATKHYCPSSDNGKHHFTHHKNTDLPEEEHKGGRHIGITHITYCRDCGWTDGHKR